MTNEQTRRAIVRWRVAVRQNPNATLVYHVGGSFPKKQAERIESDLNAVLRTLGVNAWARMEKENN